jgi:hypothetical protein
MSGDPVASVGTSSLALTVVAKKDRTYEKSRALSVAVDLSGNMNSMTHCKEYANVGAGCMPVAVDGLVCSSVGRLSFAVTRYSLETLVGFLTARVKAG